MRVIPLETCGFHLLALPRIVVGLHSQYRRANSSRIRSTCCVSALRYSFAHSRLMKRIRASA